MRCVTTPLSPSRVRMRRWSSAPWRSCAMRASTHSSLFFFQAEDGIRDLTVTGVQTCALPICKRLKLKLEINVVPYIDVMLVLLIIFMVTAPLLTLSFDVDLPQSNAKALESKQDQIGRASCRERV